MRMHSEPNALGAWVQVPVLPHPKFVILENLFKLLFFLIHDGVNNTSFYRFILFKWVNIVEELV